MTRRFGAFDGSIKNIVLATIFSPPKDRPASEISPGFPFYYDHMGFDYRILQTLLHAQFKLQKITTSPFSIFGRWLNPEINFLVQESNPTINTDAAQ